MNEQALKDSYELFKEKGYTKSFDEYVSLMNSNPQALNDSYSIFKEAGYEKSPEEFSTLIGVKKKDESVSVSPEEITESTTPDVQEENVLLESSIQENEANLEQEQQGAEFQSFAEEQGLDTTEMVSSELGGGLDNGMESTVQDDNGIDFSSATFEHKGEKDTAIERTFGKNEVTDLFGDLWRAGAAGQAQGGSVGESLELFAKGENVTDDDIQDFIAAQKRMEESGVSDEMNDFQETYQELGGGWLGFIKGVVDNPTVIPQLFVSSVSAMVTPAVLAGAAAGAGAGAAIGSTGFSAGPLGVFTTAGGAMAGAMGGAGTILETGLTYSELLQEELDGEPMTTENIRRVLGDEDAMDSIRFKAVARGLTIGAIDAISGGIAGKVTSKVATAVGKKVTSTATKNLIAGAAGGTVEAIGGSLGEVGGRLVAGQEMDIAEIGFEGIAGTATAPLTVGYGLYKSPKYHINGTDNKAKVSGPMMAKFIKEAPLADLIKAEVSIANDPELQSIYESRFKEANVSNKIKEVSPDINEPTLKAVTKLQVELNELEGNNTQVAKDKAKVLKEKINSLQENPITEGEARATDVTVDGENTETTTNVVTEDYAIEVLKEEGIDSPTSQQVIDKKEVLLKEQADAIQKSSTESVDAQEQAGTSESVGEGNTESTETTGETTQEGDVESDVTEEKEVTKEEYNSEQDFFQKTSPNAWAVDEVSEEVLDESDIREHEGTYGIVTPDGDIKGLFNPNVAKLREGKEAKKGTLRGLMAKLVDAGGTKLDNYDGRLTSLYEDLGFRVTSRTPFNEEFAPEGWNKEKDGTPDVVAMVYDPNNELDIEEKTFEGQESSYDDMTDYRDSFVKPKARHRVDGLEVNDQETSTITEEMNQMDANEIEFEATEASRDYDVNPLEESNSIKKVAKKVLDFIGVKSEKDLLKTLDYFDGIPMLTGMSDILASGTVKDSQGGNMDVDGGIMFNILGKNTEAAWAGVDEAGAKVQYDNAVALYKKNKALFEKLWADGKLPQGHVPMAIARMSDSAINSNEAIFRYISPAIKAAKKKNQVKALADLQVSLEKAKTASQASTVGKKKVAAAIKLQELIKNNKIKNLGQLIDVVLEQSKARAQGDKNTLSLDDRKLLFESIIYPTGAKKSNRAIINSLAEGNPKFNTEAFFADNIYKAIGEPSMMKGAHGDIVAVVGIDVTGNGGVAKVSHDNYGFGPKGKAIALISKPKHGIDVFSTWRAKASRVFKKDKKGRFPTKTATAQQVGGAFFNDKVFQSDSANTKQSNLDVLIGKLKFAFPSVNVANSKAEFDAILNEPGVRTKESEGKVILGLTVDGKIFINPDFDSLATPIHEFGHIWMDYLRSESSGLKGTKLLERGLKLVEGTDALKTAIEKYGDTKLAREEALVELMATKGETIANAAQKSKFKEWLNATFKYIQNNFITSEAVFKANDIENMSLEDFIDTGLADLFSGKPIDGKNKVKFDAKAESKESMARFEVGKDIKSTIKEALALGMSDKQIKFLLEKQGIESSVIKEALSTEKKATQKPVSPTEKTLKGFDRVMSEIDGIVKKSKDRGVKFSEIANNVISYLQKSKAYENATDVQREQMVRDVRKKFLKKEKSAPTASKLIGIKKGAKEITTTDKKLYVKRLNELNEGAKNAKDAIKAASQLIAEDVKSLIKKGNLTNSQGQRILARFAKVDVLNETQVDSFVEYMANVYNKSENVYKNNLIKDIVARVKKSAKKIKTDSGKVKAKSLDAEGQQFFDAMKNVLAKVLATVDGKAVKVDADGVKSSLFPNIEEILGKDESTLTTKEMSELYAYEIFDVVKDIREMSLEQVEALLADIKQGEKGGRSALQARLQEFRAEVAETKAVADKNISESYSELHNEDGSVKDANQLAADKDSRRVKLFGDGLGTSIKKYASEFKFTDMGKFITAMGNNLKHLGTLTNALDKTGTFFRDNVYNALNKMESNYTKGVQSTRTKMDDIAKTIDGINSYKDIKKKLATGVHTITGLTTSKGTPLSSDKFNADQLMRLYALSKNKVQRAKLLKQGITDEKLKQIEDILGVEVVEFADKLVEHLSTEYFEKTNEVYVDVNNVNLGYVENYFPTQTIQTKVSSSLLDDGDFSGVFNAQTSPALKERDDTTGDIDLRGSDFTTTLQDHFDTIERYKSYAKGIKKMNAIFKFSSVNTLLSETGLNKVVKNAINYAVNPNGGNPAIQPNLIDKLMTKYTGFALSFKLVQILKQSTSFVNAFEDYSYRGEGKTKIPGLDLLMFMVDGAKTIATMPAQIKRAWNISPMFQERLLKGLEGDVYGLETGSVTYKQASESQKNKVFKILKSAAGSPTVLGDVLGVMGYMINYNRDIANGMSEADALAKFEDYNATQQSRRGADKIPLQMNSNSLVRGFTMFGSTLFLQMNKVMQSVTNLSRTVAKGKVPTAKDTRALLLNLGVANVMFALAANIAKFIEGEDEDKEEALAKMKEAMSGANLIYHIPYFGAGAEMAVNAVNGEGNKPTSDVVNPITAIYRKLTKLNKKAEDEGDDKDIQNATRVAVEVALGVQFDPFIGLANTFNDGLSEESVYDMLGISPSYRPEGETASKIKADKLGQYDNETDMKRYDRNLWSKTFGPESDNYEQDTIDKKTKSDERKQSRADKDAKYNYDGTKKRKGTRPTKTRPKKGTRPRKTRPKR